VARNRKRRNDRRPRRSADEASRRPGVATARGQRADGPRPEEIADGPRPEEVADGQRPDEVADRQHPDEVEETPEALQHATPDVELAEAQLAAGRAQADITEPEDDDAEEEEEFDDLAEGAGPPPDEEPPGTQLSSRGGASPAPRGAARLVHFLQGSWRELQRVQWPDRRQVMQATGVVIGFVIVAGVFLGAADWVAQRLVNLILK
jgi:preprotein translocase SecE subunit